MSLDLNVSTLKNTVTFVVDKNSIAQAKKLLMIYINIFRRYKTPKSGFRLKNNAARKLAKWWMMQSLTLRLKTPLI